MTMTFVTFGARRLELLPLPVIPQNFLDKLINWNMPLGHCGFQWPSGGFVLGGSWDGVITGKARAPIRASVTSLARQTESKTSGRDPARDRGEGFPVLSMGLQFLPGLAYDSSSARR